jgi:uncharacterized repeat protein (TIGR03803 family)
MDGVLIDLRGNLIGTTSRGGKSGCGDLGWGCGTAYKLTQTAQGWAETTLHTFQGQPDGDEPSFAVVRDRHGNLYGTTYFGGDYGYGSLFELSPLGSQWTDEILYSFPAPHGPGSPDSRLILDTSGNLYGTTGVSVFMLSPFDGGWSYSQLYSDEGAIFFDLVMDAEGNLYGVAAGGARGCGFVYKLTKSNGSWIYSDLHDLAGGDEGCWPESLVLGSDGRIFGAALQQGQYGGGVVFEITP